jgi:hypothetical protein
VKVLEAGRLRDLSACRRRPLTSTFRLIIRN